MTQCDFEYLPLASWSSAYQTKRTPSPSLHLLSQQEKVSIFSLNISILNNILGTQVMGHNPQATRFLVCFAFLTCLKKVLY